MRAKLIGESSAGMTAVEIYDDQDNLVWSQHWFDNGATGAEYKTGLAQVIETMQNCKNHADWDYGMVDEDGEPVPMDTAETNGVICEYDSETCEWTGGDYTLGQSTEIAAALMRCGKLDDDEDVLEQYDDIEDLNKIVVPGYIIAYASSDAPGGLKLIGQVEDCSADYPETARVFGSEAEAKTYIAEREPLLDAGNIKPAHMWL